MIIKFRTAVAEITDHMIIATFTEDGQRNEFGLSWVGRDPEYRKIAEWAGYGQNWRQYAIEHELTHHWLADRMAWRYSYSLHDNPPMPWPEHVAWEEHLVNAVQRLGRTGERDPAGALQSIWPGEQLVSVIHSWWDSVVKLKGNEHV